MFGVVKLAAASAVLAAAIVTAMEPASPVLPRGDRLIVKFEPAGAAAAVRPVRVIAPDRRPVPARAGSASS